MAKFIRDLTPEERKLSYQLTKAEDSAVFPSSAEVVMLFIIIFLFVWIFTAGI